VHRLASVFYHQANKEEKPNLFSKELILCLKRDFILKQQQQPKKNYSPHTITIFNNNNNKTDKQFSSAEKRLTFCDTIRSQQTLYVHKKYKTEEIHFGIVTIVI
jgi:hypothetical protein